MAKIEEIASSASSASIELIELLNPIESLNSKPLTSESPLEVFEEIFKLLEEYGPTWYSEDLHNRAQAALRKISSINLNHRSR